MPPRLYGFAAEHRDRLAGLVPPPLRRGAERTLQRRAEERPEAEPEQAPDPSPEQPRPKDRDPHHVLSISTSEPHPSKDPEAGDRWEGPKRDKLDK